MKRLSWPLTAVALLMLGLTLTPAEVWSAPAADAAYRGFDPNLVFVNRSGTGVVHVSPTTIDMTAAPGSQPTANLATSLLPKLNASLDVKVIASGGGPEPFRVGLWSPWTGAGEFIVFGPPPQNRISAETIRKGRPGSTLQGGDVGNSTELGSYELGQTYHVTVVLDKPAGRTITDVTGPDGRATEARVTSDLFGNVQVSLTASATGESASTRVVLSNYSLTLPHQRFWASKVADGRATAMLLFLALAGTLLLIAALVAHIQRERPRAVTSNFRLRVKGRGSVLIALVGAVGVYLVGNALLFPLGNHPFDMAHEKLFAYVGRTYGPAQLYYLPNTVSVAGIWHGVPYVEAAFPYEPVSAYLHTAIGWLSSLLFAGGGAFSPNSAQLEYVTKAVNVAFGLADAVLIYLILRQIRTSVRWSLTAAALFAFNPAVWFSMSVWGQTHVFSLFFVLVAILFAEKHLPTWAWLTLAAACLTRPQMLVFGLILGIVFLRKFSWTENVTAVSWTVIVTFLALTPLTLATSPSLPVDIMVHNLNVQEAGGNVAALTTVSQDAYSIWPLVTYLAHGALGLQRAFTPSSSILIGPLSYQRVSQLLTLAAMLLVAGALIFRKRATDGPGSYLPFVALGVCSFLMLLTGIVATHFLLALPFLLLAHRWMGGIAYFYVAAIWTVTTFVPMFGDLGVAISSLDYPLLSPVHNAITKLFVDLYAWDRFITVAVVANVCGLIWLGFLAFRSSSAAPVRS